MVSDLAWSGSHFGPGSRVGKYALEEQLGQGGMAVVFRARDDQLGRMVALKIMAPSVAADPEFRERFIRESRAAAAVDDPHIIPLFEAGDAAGLLFIAMRYVAGGDVRSLLTREGTLSVGRVATILTSVASALDAAHAAGLVHRDVKPGNLLLDIRQGRADHVYLADFGLTKATVATGLTSTGRFVGTAHYAAPEQITGRPVDGRADQYALACTAVEMLTGKPPFPLDNMMAVLTAHTVNPPPLVSLRRRGLPGELDAVIGRALAKSPSDRYPSCGEFAAAFQRAARAGGYSAPLTQVLAGHRSEAGAATAGAGGGHPRTIAAGGLAPPAPETGVSRRRGPRLAIAATAATAAVGAVVAYLVLAAPGHAPGQHSAGTGQTATGSQSTPRLHTYDDPGGFSIGLPPGWAVASKTPGDVQFTGTPGGFVLVVAWRKHSHTDALADWQQQSVAKAAADPSYRRISIRRVSYRGYNAADWQFTDVYQGIRIRAIDRTFIVSPGRLSYAIELYGPASRWPAVYARIWQPLMTSFRLRS